VGHHVRFDSTGGALGIDHLEARWDITYHVLNAGGVLPRQNPFNEALVNLPDDGSRLWFLARSGRALFFFPSFVIFPAPEVVADELAQADDLRWWRTRRRKRSRRGGSY
jgi:hypothetical protein